MGIYNILDYGAVSDGGLATEAIQKAIDACFLGGGGTVLVPEGNYLTGGLRIRSDVTLHLQKNAVLVGSRDPEDYTTYIADTIEPLTEEDRNQPVSTSLTDSRSVVPCSRWNNAVIRGVRAKNIAIIGEEGSVIDGRNCFDAIGEENYRGPHGINLWYCENITLKGYTIRDCANWGHAIQNSRNIQAERITVLGGHDGFDVRTCDDVTIRSCQFLTGDDCIAGFDNNNVTVTDCTYSSACSFLRFGGHNVLFENCRAFAPSVYGFRKGLSDEKKREGAPCDENCRYNCHTTLLYYCDFRADIRQTPGNIIIRNCDFKNPNSLFRHPYGHIWCRNRGLRDITYENCRIEGLSNPGEVIADPAQPLQITLRNCSITAREAGADFPLLNVENAVSVIFENVEITGFRMPCISGTVDCKLCVTGGTPVALREKTE